VRLALLFALALAVLNACATQSAAPVTSSPPPATSQETTGGQTSTMETWIEMEIVGLERDSLELGGELDTALSAAALDCDAAGDLRDRICELADRICEISQRHPESPSTGERCQQGNQRCEDARSSVGESCE
jgi:hypothetical protein